MAIAVGKGRTKYTHGNKLKRVTFRLLPKKGDAIRNKPRGTDEMKKCLSGSVHKKAFLVMDKSSYGAKAADALGYKHAPPVNHSAGWRDVVTGFHTNDAESENQRVKHFCRRRNGDLRGLSEAFMYEYVFYTNCGSSMAKIMNGLALSNGGKQTTRLVL
jgi:hypothetical protein